MTATGLNLLALGGVDLVVDGRAVDLGDTFVYRGAMLSGVPNLAVCLGYNSSWTLRAEVTHAFVCRVLDYLDEHGAESATPVAPSGMRPRPVLELTSGYVLRGQDTFPKQGDRRLDHPAELVRRPPLRAARSGRAGHDLRRAAPS